jgi:exosortase
MADTRGPGLRREPGAARRTASEASGHGPRAPGGLAFREWALALLLLVAFAPALQGLAAIWSRVDYLSHGFLVPVVALWALLRERPRRARVPVAPDAWGAALLGAALLVYLVGLASGSVPMQGVALVAAVAGGVWFSRGAAFLRAAAFPVGFLVFMVPPPPDWITPLIVELQLFVSSVSLAILQGIGVTVLRDGNVLTLPGGGSLFIAEACSGVTSIITLAPLGVFLAYFSLRGTVVRALLVLAVIPLAMAGNLVRVVVTVLVAERFGIEVATEGPLHDALGLSTYVVACILILGVGAVLRRSERAA